MKEQQQNAGRPDGAEDAERIAVVGMAGRFPGADSVSGLWHLLENGADAVRRFTEAELAGAGVPAELAADPRYVPAKGVLEDIAGFDSALFGYGALEASIVDPQQRIFLEVALAALEDAGCDPDRAPGSIAVYGGSMLSTYLIHHLLPRADLPAKLGIPLLFQGNQPDQLAARVAYKLDLRGPAITVQTACSSSLVAVHLAASSLLSQECDVALAGGVTVTLPDRAGYLPTEGGIESPDGRCRPFGAEANGTVFGNGAAVVVLKRLSDAIADGDRVHAVILGSAVTNDGAAKAGYTAPGVAGQTAALREALDMAGTDPRTIGYVEAHGTGTAIGDTIEVAALSAVYGDGAVEGPAWCGLGSVKSNIGHLDTAAGVTGLIKSVLTLRAGQIPASLHAGKTHPDLGLDGSPFFVPDRLVDWPVDDGPRRAAVSAFGIGGTNAHVVLEQAPEPAPRPGRPRKPRLLPISAATGTALSAAAGRLADDLAARPGGTPADLADVAFTLQTGRRQLPHRRVVVADDTDSAIAALRSGGRRVSVSGQAGPGEPAVAFVFPGQGAQFAGMAQGLSAAEPVFAAALDECAHLLAGHSDLDLIDLLRHGSGEALRRTTITQPVVFCVSYALTKLFEHRGIRPAAVLGHSAGEYAAACAAGVFTLSEALSLVVARGRALDETPAGAMLAVPLAENEASALAARHGVDLAAVNGPASCVLSGTQEGIAAATAELAGTGVRAVRLPADRAFHSRLCAAAEEAFSAALAEVTPKEPTVPFVSTVTGTWITGEAAGRDYWLGQLRAPVRFHDALTTLSEMDGRVVAVEAGPGTVLADLARAGDTGLRFAPAPLPSRGRSGPAGDEVSALLSVAGRWTEGVPVDWARFGEPGSRRTSLPGYPYEHRHHWIEPGARPSAVAAGVPGRDGGAVHAALGWREDRSPAVDPLAERRFTWLVFADPDGATQPVTDFLTARGQIVTCVVPGDGFRRVRRGVYEIDPARGEDYQALLRELRALVRTPTAVLHGWTAGGDADARAADGELGPLSLIRLARAMAAEALVTGVSVGVLTAGGHAVEDGDPVDPSSTAMSGPVLVLPEEFPNLRCTQIDLPATAAVSPEQAEQVVRAVLRPSSGIVALRAGRTLVRVPVAAPLPEPVGLPAVLKPRGTYVVTGGLGGIGRSVAEYLATTCSARLVLLGRRAGAADEETWLDRLRAEGAEVLVLAADVADAQQLRHALRTARSRFGRIDGVVHAAGVPGGGSVALRTDEDVRAVLAPKVAGTRNLLAELSDDEADFLILCSSTASVLPTYGQADYAAANAYLDGVAAAAADPARRTIAVNWDMWAQVGMAASAEVPADLESVQRAALAGALTTEQGVAAFAAVLGGTARQVLVLREGAVIGPDGGLDLGITTPATATTSHPRPDLDTPYAAPETGTERRLARLYAESLGLDRVGVQDEFLDLGGHSLLAAQLATRLRAEFGVDVPARAFFEGGRIADVAEEIEARIIADLESHERA
jgi:acyl transferase domain-containing protein/acyl carrier protein